MSEFLEKLTEAIKAGKRKDARAATEAAINANDNPQEILDALSLGMADVGRRFKANEIFVPEVLVAARAMQKSMDLLEPLLAESGIEPDHTVVLGTVQGDLHDIGKNLVGMMLKGAAYRVVDLGTNVSAEVFAQAAAEHKAEIVGLSALLTTTMPAMKETVELLKDKDVKIMIGGAPITQEYCDQIGADGYSADAASAVDLADRLCSKPDSSH